MYKVVRTFKDVDGTIYRVGDVFPKEGNKKPSAARLKVLSTIKNKYAKVYIEKVGE